MNIPLLGSLAYLLALVAADVALLFGAHAGMAGAGHGASLAQWAGAATQLVLLHRKGIFDPRDMAALPRASDLRFYVGLTPGLCLNNLAALAPTLVATT